jgi:hypothetical protein
MAIDNGDFDEYWVCHRAREHERLYAGSSTCQLTA